MALPGDGVWEVRAGGNDLNGGLFNPARSGGTDRTQQDAAYTSGTNLAVSTANTDVIPDGYTPVSSDVGNTVRIASGTGFTVGTYEIVSIQTSPTRWRLDRSPGSVGISGGTWRMGGACATPGFVAGLMVAGNIAYIKAGTYLITSASTNVSNGCMAASTSNVWIGYDTNRTMFSGDTKPILRFSGISSCVMFATNAVLVENLELDGNSVTSGQGMGNTNSIAINCVGKNFANGAFRGTAINCYATGCSSQSPFQGNSYNCTADGNTITGFASNSAVTFHSCLSANNAGASSYGFSSTGNAMFVNCVAYGNGSEGFRLSGGAANSVAINCIAMNNGGWGYYLGGYGRVLKNCAWYNNTSGTYTDVATGPVFVTDGIGLTADPFVDAANGDFRLNETSGAGALLRNAGWPSTQPGASSTATYLDIGVARHQDPASSGAMILSRVFGGF